MQNTDHRSTGGLAVFFAFLSMLTGCERHAQPKVLNLFAWSEYIPQEVIDGFTKESGVQVNYETYDSNEAMLTKLAQGRGRYDLIQPSEYAVEALIRRQMLAPLDFAKVPNVKNLDPAMRDLPYDPGQKYSVPYMSGTVGIIVNTQKVSEPIRGYRDVFRPQFARHIVVIDDNREIVSWAFDVLGIPVNDVTPQNLAKAKPILAQWIPLMVFAPSDPKPPLLSGDCILGVVYSGDAAKLIEADKKFRYVLPEEGTHQFIDNLCVPASAPHKDEAMAFINYVLRPEVSKIISDKFPYTNPNLAARKLLTGEQLDNPASYPPPHKFEIFHDLGPVAGEIGKLMTELRAGG